MDYNMLLDSHKRFGTTKEDIATSNHQRDILENVVIAPWWKVKMFENKNDIMVTKINDKLYNIKKGDIEFTFIELKRMGAPMIMEELLPLGVSNCKNLIFIGSVGSLDKSIGIGDLAVPMYSVCGDGACRYLNDNLEDEFGKKQYPSKNITELLISVTEEECKKAGVKFHNVTTFSLDTIFAQFIHIDKIIEMGCQTIEMETAALFKSAEIAGINTTALFCVSDCTVTNKSLYSGRTEEEENYRYHVRNNVMPYILFKVFEKLK